MKLEGGSYNCLRGRDPAQAVAFVKWLLVSFKLDFLCLQESQDYVHQLRDIEGYRLIDPARDAFGRRVKGHSESTLLVRDGVKVTRVRRRRLGRAGWTTVKGHEVPARSIPVALLDGWLNVGSVHFPPSVFWRIDPKPKGPRQRVAAYVRGTERLAVIFARGRGRFALAGDWNEPATTHGRHSPRYLARRIGASTHTSGGIDFLMQRGCRVSKFYRVPSRGGSDHHPFVFSLRPAR